MKRRIAATIISSAVFLFSCQESTAPPPGSVPDPEPQPDSADIWEATSLPFNGTVQDILSIGDDTLFVATWGGGLFRSADSGMTWERIAFYPNDIDDVICLASSADGALLCGSAAFNGLYRSTDGGQSWLQTQELYGLPEDLDARPNGEILAAVFSEGVFHSRNNGVDWQILSTSLDDRLLSVCFTTSGHYLAGTNSGLYRSTDQGTSWTMSLTGTGRFVATNFNHTLFVGIGNSVYRSWNEGSSWIMGDTLGVVGPLAAHDNGALYAGTDQNGVFLSVDEGASWTPLAGGLPDGAIRSLAVTPAGYVYVGTWLNGLYKSKDPIPVR